MDGFAVNTNDYNNLKKKIKIDNKEFVSLKSSESLQLEHLTIKKLIAVKQFKFIPEQSYHQEPML